jgi:VanZ family protein
LEPKKSINLALALLWTTVITYLSLASVEGLSSQIQIPNKDKIVHFSFYFGFVYLWWKGLAIQQNSAKTLLLCSAIGYGLLMELLQYYCTTNRSADIWDILANSLGAITCFYWLKRKFK